MPPRPIAALSEKACYCLKVISSCRLPSGPSLHQGVVLVRLEGAAETAEAAKDAFVGALATAVGFSLPEKGATAASAVVTPEPHRGDSEPTFQSSDDQKL